VDAMAALQARYGGNRANPDYARKRADDRAPQGDGMNIGMGMGSGTGPPPGGVGRAGLAEGNAQVISRNLFLEERFRLSGDLPSADGTEIHAALEQRRRPRLSRQIDIPVPRTESGGELRLERNTPFGLSSLGLGLKAAMSATDTGFGPNTVWSAGFRQAWVLPWLAVLAPDGRLALEYSRNAPADEHPLLELTAMKDIWRGEATVPLPLRMRLDVRAGGLYFYHRDRSYLGSGAFLEGRLDQRPTRVFGYGIESGYRRYRPGAPLQGNDPTDPIAGLLPAGEFPQSYWQSYAHAEWGEDSPDPSRSSLAPFLATELGFSRFLAAAGLRSAHWEPEFGFRAGLAFCPTRTQSISLLGSYSQGIRSATEKALQVETRYQHILK
jgi:hypothetical protein